MELAALIALLLRYLQRTLVIEHVPLGLFTLRKCCDGDVLQGLNSDSLLLHLGRNLQQSLLAEGVLPGTCVGRVETDRSLELGVEGILGEGSRGVVLALGDLAERVLSVVLVGEDAPSRLLELVELNAVEVHVLVHLLEQVGVLNDILSISEFLD